MRTVRLVALILALAIALGPTVLDRCLLRCHGDAAAPATPACHHQSDATDALTVHGVAACGHDHESLVADSAADRRAPNPRHLDAPALPVAIEAMAVAPVWSAWSCPPRLESPSRSGPQHLQLRV